MENKHLEQQIRIAQSKIQQKKREFLEIQSMDMEKLKEVERQNWDRSPEYYDREAQIQRYLQLRKEAPLVFGDEIEPTKYSLSLLTIQQCRKLHQKLKQKKRIYQQEIKTTDSSDLNAKYWRMYSEFMNDLSTNQHNATKMSQDIAEIKTYISILNQPIDYQNLKVSCKQPLTQQTLKDLDKRYQKLERRVNDKDSNDLGIDQIMQKAKKYFEKQYGPPSPQSSKQKKQGFA